jgi:hypothetical protein
LKQLNAVIQKYFKFINKYVSNVRIAVKYRLYGGIEQWSSIPFTPISGFSIPTWIFGSIGVDLNYIAVSDYANISGIIEKILKVEITWK